MTNTELNAILTKEAKKDVARAKKHGELLIGDTKLGTLRLFRVADGIFQLNTQGIDARKLVLGTAAEVVSTLAPLYLVGL